MQVVAPWEQWEHGVFIAGACVSQVSREDAVNVSSKILTCKQAGP